jgi:hypothetical protein
MRLLCCTILNGLIRSLVVCAGRNDQLIDSFVSA